MRLFTQIVKTRRIPGKILSSFLLVVCLFLTSSVFAGSGIFQTYAIINKGSGNQFYAGGINSDNASLIFNNNNLGSFCPTATLILNGGEIKTYQNSGSNVSGAKLAYRIYRVGDAPGTFQEIGLFFNADLGNGDKKWQTSGHNVNMLAGLTAGNYYLEVYWVANSTDGDHYDSNFGNNFKATFSVNPFPILSANVQNLSCFGGGNGSINLMVSGLTTSPPPSQTFSQDFNTLAISGTSSVLPASNPVGNWGWYLAETDDNANSLYTAGTGSANTGDTYSFGAAGSIERAFGGLLSGSLVPFIGGFYTNNTGSYVNSINITYTGEQWRLGATGRTDRLDFQYSLNATSLSTGTWVDFNGLDFSSPVTTGSVGALDGNSNKTNISGVIPNLNIPPGGKIWIGWKDLDASSSDDGLAIDDFSITFSSVSQPNVTFLWSNNATTQNLTGLTADTYTVVATSGACSTSASYTINTPSEIIVTETHTTPSCAGGNGTVTISATGGTGALTGTGSFNKAAGTHQFTVTDANNCSKTISVTVTDPPAIVLTHAYTAITCYGGTSTVTITATGGTGALTGTGTFTRTAGSHDFTVTDGNGCTKTATVNISQPADLAVSESHSAILCNGGSATVTVSATGGTGAFSGTGNFQQAAGSHTYTVTDANGCTKSITVTLTEPVVLDIDASPTNVSCSGVTNGAIDITVTGGTPGVKIFEDFNTLANSGTSSTLPVGWALAESGANGNTIYTAGTGTSNTGDTYSFGATGSTERAFGSLLSGSLTPYIGYQFTNNTGHTITSINVAYTGEQWRLGVASRTGVSPDLDRLDFVYSTDATDLANGTWTDVNSLDFIEPVFNGTVGALDGNLPANRKNIAGSINGLSIPNGATVWIGWRDFNASGSDDGLAIDDVTLSFNFSGPVYSYLWSNNATTQDISALSVGNYSVTVTDGNGCTATLPVLIDEPDALVASYSNQQNVNCFGNSTGSVEITAIGGTTPYTGTGVKSNLAAGPHTFTVTDANNCSTSITVNISQPDAALQASATDQQNVNCYGQSTGSVVISATGGTGAYIGTGTKTGLAAGPHTFIVTDANNCSTSVTVNITQPDAVLQATASNQQNVNCFGQSTGSVLISATGGTGNYTGVGLKTGLAAGPHTFIVTDENSCSSSVTVNITQPQSALTATCTTNNGNLYFGYPTDQSATVSVTVGGGTGPYTITATMNRALKCNWVNSAGDESWTAGAGATSTTNNSCSAATLPTVAPVTTFSGPGINAGTYSVNVTLLADATITFTITDANGCTTTCTQFIHAEDVRCFSGNSGNAKVTICHQTGNSKNPCIKICVDESALAEHLSHGDYVGACLTNCAVPGNLVASTEEPELKLELQVIPNPTPDFFNIYVKSPSNEPITLRVMDMFGRTVMNNNVAANSRVKFGHNLAGGTYFVQAVQGKTKLVQKVIKVN